MGKNIDCEAFTQGALEFVKGDENMTMLLLTNKGNSYGAAAYGSQNDLGLTVMHGLTKLLQSEEHRRTLTSAMLGAIVNCGKFTKGEALMLMMAAFDTIEAVNKASGDKK